ncbi:MAG: hypothetical protein WAY93_05710 [Atopobiaceae bacterium]|jgi:hypothetical protein|nr:hypothetical protein [Atopobiaceae bacterium]
MYAVSEAYLVAMASPSQRHRATGSLVGTDGTKHAFDNSGILSGSLSLVRQCSEGDEVKIGSVYVSELDVTLTEAESYRSTLGGASVDIFFGLELADGSWEDVPMGKFFVSKAEWGESGVAIVAYDSMAKLDKEFSSTTTTGSPYFLAKLACDSCGVDLGMSEIEMSNLPNGGETLSLMADSDVQTWRDFVSWISQAMACFATVDRSGSLVFKRYPSTTTKVASTGPSKRWSGAKFSDFSTRYTGLSIVEMADLTTTYYHVTPDDGLTMNLGQNPLLQKGLIATRKRQRESILSAIQSIDYVPFDLSSIGDPAWDLGDVLDLSGGIAGQTAFGCVMKSTWTLNGGVEVQGYGSDPALVSASSKTDKNLSGILSKVSDSEVNYYAFTNSGNFSLGPRTLVIEIDFASKSDTIVEFSAQCLLSCVGEVEEDSSSKTYHRTVLTVSYELNGTEFATFHPIESWVDGSHILHLYRPFSIQAGTSNVLLVYMAGAYGTVDIGPGQIQAMVSGKGLAADLSGWDGQEKLSESLDVSLVSTESSLDVTISAEVASSSMQPQEIPESESMDVSLVSTDSSPYIPQSDSMQVGQQVYAVITDNSWAYDFDRDAVTTVDGFRSDGSQAVTTDLQGTDITAKGITSFDANCSEDVVFSMSADGGKTWLKRSSGSWSESSSASDGCQKSDLSSLTEEDWKIFSGGYELRFWLASKDSYLYSAVLTYDWSWK